MVLALLVLNRIVGGSLSDLSSLHLFHPLAVRMKSWSIICFVVLPCWLLPLSLVLGSFGATSAHTTNWYAIRDTFHSYRP